MARSERIVPGYCPNCKSEDCECMGSPVVPCAVCGEVGIPLNEAGECNRCAPREGETCDEWTARCREIRRMRT